MSDVVSIDSIEPAYKQFTDHWSLEELVEKINKRPASFTGTKFCHRGSVVTLTRLRVREEFQLRSR